MEDLPLWAFVIALSITAIVVLLGMEWMLRSKDE